MIERDAVHEIRERLAKYPHVRYEATSHSVVVHPIDDTGFTVSLKQSRALPAKRFFVSFDGRHEDFDSQSEALECFAFGLSAACRLRVVRRGTWAYRWTVESLTDGRWHPDTEVGLLFFPFWLRREVVYLQNTLISVD